MDIQRTPAFAQEPWLILVAGVYPTCCTHSAPGPERGRPFIPASFTLALPRPMPRWSAVLPGNRLPPRHGHSRLDSFRPQRTSHPQRQRGPRAFFQQLLVARRERVGALTFDVNGSNHFSALWINNGHDNFRKRTAERGQVPRISSHIAHEDGRFLPDGHAGQSAGGGKGW